LNGLLRQFVIELEMYKVKLREFASEQKIAEITRQTGKDVRMLLLDNSKIFRYARWNEQRQELALTCDELEFHTCVGLRKKSQQWQITTSQVLRDIAAIQSCGHDLTGILAWGLRGILGTNDPHTGTPFLLEKPWRLAYEHEYFQKTQRYACLQLWEMTHHPFVVLREPPGRLPQVAGGRSAF
jgi:hypothetical protein